MVQLPGRIMRSRLLQIASCLLLTAATASAAQAIDLSQQRQYYDEAKRALAKGDEGPYLRYSQALSDYPLTPYLAYDELTARLKSASNEEIEGFLAQHGDLPQANWMKLRWLRWLSERGEWATFASMTTPSSTSPSWTASTANTSSAPANAPKALPALRSCGTWASRNLLRVTRCLRCGRPKVSSPKPDAGSEPNWQHRRATTHWRTIWSRP